MNLTLGGLSGAWDLLGLGIYPGPARPVGVCPQHSEILFRHVYTWPLLILLLSRGASVLVS